MTHLRIDHGHNRKPGDSDEIGESDGSETPTSRFLERLLQVDLDLVAGQRACQVPEARSTSERH